MKLKSLSTLMLPMMLLAACNDAPAPAKTDAAQPAQSSEAKADASAPQASNGGKTYVVVSQPAYPPFASRNEKGELVGLDIDLLQEIAKKEGFNLTFVPHTMEGLLETVNTGAADIVATGVNITPEREQTYTFSKPYLEANWIVVADKNKTKFASFADLKDKKIAAQKASLSETQLKSTGITSQIVSVETVYLGLNGIARGENEAVYDVDAVLNTYLKADAPYYSVVDEKSGKVPFGWVLKKGNTELKEKLDKGIDDLKADGTYQKILDKWYPKQ
ncbi:ABC transporter substrate-binding protein [Kingella negevensis]|uniref:substrate-binding periplasmic protein n=1 Tax=Kingella negevensis TaxID=1522312 RepID=UPI002542F5FB|nr:ABC transporter substrate-binding protein [Kingella negevensis]MDK4681132.1 ABC transporter substrate-binding protein [Kingella negevensis]MDK4683334.1 ABC transporter substrate-binding protein [Kingella negevensis]MDK4691536.1 ABC transporter substrate-binding protein [Kingella negevensis]MDK4693313.1 ABC transporter substrate-binding protein [Kingella negevensis]MDK4699613.1 ABC transporter substrate-binding protein [Kingella negevensis]